MTRIANLPQPKQAVDSDFQEELRKFTSDLSKWWKTHYNYSSNDERYKTATDSQIVEDFLENKFTAYIKELGIDTEMERIVKGRQLDPEFDRKENEAWKNSFKRARVIKNNKSENK